MGFAFFILFTKKPALSLVFSHLGSVKIAGIG